MKNVQSSVGKAFYNTHPPIYKIKLLVKMVHRAANIWMLLSTFGITPHSHSLFELNLLISLGTQSVGQMTYI